LIPQYIGNSKAINKSVSKLNKDNFIGNIKIKKTSSGLLEKINAPHIKTDNTFLAPYRFLIFFSESTGRLGNKLGRYVHWMVLYVYFVFQAVTCVP
jgi:hypothetical protein